MSEKPIHVQCGVCDARWKLCDAPIEVGLFVELLLKLQCPHCQAGPKRIGMCPRDAAEPRDPDPTKLAAAQKTRTKKGSK